MIYMLSWDCNDQMGILSHAQIASTTLIDFRDREISDSLFYCEYKYSYVRVRWMRKTPFH